MSIDRARAHLRALGMEERVLEFEVSSATVELAAAAVGCEPARIAKTLSFHVGEHVALVVAAGDARIDNPKFKAHFGCKAKMLKAEEAEPLVGHGVGGVCPFGVNEGVEVCLDESLRRFDTVYPAAGSAASAVRLSPDELARCSAPCTWVDVCKIPEADRG
ncbi:MAG TPA: YbaK/EbsC family protein [Candidatus Rubneribacter avistercoris]|nr:YbaK/EbsC family protein [Candidatus Rubneribacter avistercoris]